MTMTDVLSRLARGRDRLRRRLAGCGLVVPAWLLAANLVPQEATAALSAVSAHSASQAVLRAVGVAPVAFSPDGKTVALGGAGHVRQFGRQFASMQKELSDIRLWDIATGKLLWAFEGDLGQVNSLSFSPDGKSLAYCDSQSVGMINVQTGQLERILKTATLTPRQ
jgi:WD40 repeat protein